MAKYIAFVEVMPHPNGVWAIANKRSGDFIGRVEWYPPWKRYVAIFSEGSVWSHDCLKDVSDFILSKSGGD
jgi:hypothetical protein